MIPLGCCCRLSWRKMGVVSRRRLGNHLDGGQGGKKALLHRRCGAVLWLGRGRHECLT